MSISYKKAFFIGGLLFLTTAGTFFKLGYNEGRKDQRRQDLFEVKSYAGAFIDKGRYWKLSGKERKEFVNFADNVNLLVESMQDTSGYMHTIEDKLIEKANSK